MQTLFSLLIGALAAPLVGLLCFLLLSWVFTWRTRFGARRHFMAFALGFVPGTLVGFCASCELAAWLVLGREGSWRTVLWSTLMGTALASSAGFSGLLVGMRWARARRVTNYCGERAAWGLVWVGLPAALVGAVAGVLLAASSS